MADRPQLYWLALLHLRVLENTTSDTWRNARHEFDRMHLVTPATPEGKVAQPVVRHRRPEEDLGRP